MSGNIQCLYLGFIPTFRPGPTTKSRFDKGPEFDANDRIRVSTLVVIDADGTNLGQMSKIDALARAREQELDLVLIAPNLVPPVARILSWSKFKYEQSKKKKDNKGHKSETKEMWFKPKIEEGDIAHKLKRVKEFIEKGDRVKITVKVKGRVLREQVIETMERIKRAVSEFAEVEGNPKFEGRNFTAFIKRK